jgi:hypothetical protein
MKSDCSSFIIDNFSNIHGTLLAFTSQSVSERKYDIILVTNLLTLYEYIIGRLLTPRIYITEGLMTLLER